MTVTEKQFARMIYLNGKKNTSVANSDRRLVFLERTTVMKINFSILDEPIELSNATILTIEDVSVFSNLVRQLYSYTEESELKLFDKKLKSLKRVRAAFGDRYFRL